MVLIVLVLVLSHAFKNFELVVGTKYKYVDEVWGLGRGFINVLLLLC